MLGQTLAGRYKLTRILGAGGFGQTYLAIDTQQSNRPQCVVKQLQPASQDVNFLTVARRLFETEVKTLKRLGFHAQIPTLVDSFEEDSEFYLVQEYIDGQSLEDEIKQAGKFTEAGVIALLESVLPVLRFIHEKHVVHRDLKPDNLIRRRDTGEMVLIDFGAVKEIRTRAITGEQTALTIGIGTQGYTPSEQLSGKPRYSSDLYALGMTAIHALTGRSPTDLPEDFDSLDPRWQDYADVSPGLAILLGKMTRHYIYQRYASAADVERDLKRLDELVAEAAAAATYVETSIPQDALPKKVPVVRWRMGRRARIVTAAIATVATSAFVLGLRQMGSFVDSELTVHDWLTSTQPDRGPDPRLLLVEITEKDLQNLGAATPSDGSISTVIENLHMHEPAVVGLDLLRNIAHGPGTPQLRKSLVDHGVVAITKIGFQVGEEAIPPPPGMTLDQLSFSDIVADDDFRVRRSFIRADLSEKRMFSVGIKLAVHYLERYENIGKNIGSTEADTLQLGDVTFDKLTPSFGGYQNIDIDGYQIFMRYRSPQNITRRISFSDVLKNNFDPELIENKIVLIGSTTTNNRDLFFTAYNTSGDSDRVPGVILHAQVISQILSVVLDGEILPWALPDWVEITWIIALTGAGGTLMVLTQKGPVLIAFGLSGLTVACLVSVVCFQFGGWVPMSAPMSAFFLSAAGARISKSYQRRHWEARQ